MGNEFEEFCRCNNIYIKYLGNLTTKVRGFCYYIDGEYLVVINDKLCTAGCEHTVLHELSHIFKNHFSYNPRDADICEKQVKGILKNIDELKRKYSCEMAIM